MNALMPVNKPSLAKKALSLLRDGSEITTNERSERKMNSARRGSILYLRGPAVTSTQTVLTHSPQRLRMGAHAVSLNVTAYDFFRWSNVCAWITHRSSHKSLADFAGQLRFIS